MWELKWGEQLPKLILLQEGGVNVPSLNNRPQLSFGQSIYFKAYSDLQADRQIGMAVGSIPWSSLLKWAQREGMAGDDDFELLCYNIRMMENAAHEFQERKKGKD